jgi:hypothetical protein
MTIRPDRYRNAIVPHIYVDGASDGIEFYKRAFGAVELFRMAHPNGKVLHSEISIAGSVVMIGDPDDKLYSEPRALGRCTASLHIFLDDNAALLRRGRGGCGRNPATHRHVLWRQFCQRARPLRPCLGVAVVEGRSRSGRDGTSWKGIPGPVSEVTCEPGKRRNKECDSCC